MVACSDNYFASAGVEKVSGTTATTLTKYPFGGYALTTTANTMMIRYPSRTIAKPAIKDWLFQQTKLVSSYPIATGRQATTTQLPIKNPYTMYCTSNPVWSMLKIHQTSTMTYLRLSTISTQKQSIKQLPSSNQATTVQRSF